MAGVDRAHFKGEGGSVFLMDLPLPNVIQQKMTKGYLRRVNADGSPYVEPVEPAKDGGEPPELEPPAPSAVKAEWVGYAVRVHDADPDEAEALTKADLIDTYGPKPE